MNLNKCPQCENTINESTNRLIQDACGHQKCRICLLNDETKCETCRIENSTVNNINDNVNKNGTDPKEIKKTENVKSNTNILKSVSALDHILVISKSPLLLKCTVCCKTFRTYTNKKYHAYCGGIEKPLKCNYCDKRFISQSHLETHVLKHSGIRPFVCSICKASFIQRSKLNRHMKIHTGDRPFVCSECGKRFSNKDALTGHYRIHSGDKPYSCKKCESKFNNKSNLSKHLSTHAKDKLFMCEECSKKFVNKSALASHRRCHSQERPHMCQHCQKLFTSIKDLRRHEVIHLGIKPYECNICKAKFCRKDNLERHLKNTHCINGDPEIKSASTKVVISRKQEQHKHNISLSKNINETDVSTKCNLSYKKSDGNVILEENPNAITVIKTCSLTQENAVSVINGPFKLAFKTDAFKNNYNIFKKDYTESAPPRIQTKKPYDMVESLNICQKILSPMHIASQKVENLDNIKPKNVIMSVGKVNEKDSVEICKKILTTIDVPPPPLHYETSFEEKKHALIKNIKFKLPSTYTNIITDKLPPDSCMDGGMSIGVVTNTKHDIKSKSSGPELIDLQPTDIPCKLSVIVNPQACDISQRMCEKYWRKQNSQNSIVKEKNI